MPVSTGNDDDDDDLNLCSICRYPFDDKVHIPLILPCGHTLCNICMDLIFSSEASKWRCPEDRQPFTKSQVRKNIELLRSMDYIRKIIDKSGGRISKPGEAHVSPKVIGIYNDRINWYHLD